MKTYLKLSFVFFALIMMSVQVNAQKIKFGHSDTNAIFEKMPEAKDIQKKLQAETEKIQNRITAMQTEYQQLVQEYTENEQLVAASPEKWSAADKSDKESAIRSLEERITKYQQNAQVSLQQKQSDLIAPIQKKIQDAVSKIRKEEGFLIIFDDQVLLDYDQEAVIDINPMLKKEMGLQ
ncbi:MAG: OmpH family outer membrane protein [Bacteroidota bacterium]|nr:OmpH family outer membrane protein [Bacteroidota bacterium]